MIGRWRALSAPTYSSSKRSGWLKSHWIVVSCHAPADGVLDVDVDLRAVERGVALLDRVRQAVPLERAAQRLGGLLPDLVGADVLLGILGRQVELEVVEAERPQHAR